MSEDASTDKEKVLWGDQLGDLDFVWDPQKQIRVPKPSEEEMARGPWKLRLYYTTIWFAMVVEHAVIAYHWFRRHPLP